MDGSTTCPGEVAPRGRDTSHKRQTMADLILFPAFRRIGSIRRTAKCLAGYRASGAEKTLAHRLRQHRDALLRIGFSQTEVEADTRALEFAIRAETAKRTRGAGRCS